jgi:apolipoprotein N-acyltransferase
VWWRAQLRVRNAALEKVARPIQRAQVFALVVNLAVVAAFVLWQARHGINWLSWFSLPALQRVMDLQTLWSGVSIEPDWNLMIWLPCFGALALLSGMVVYLTRERK